MSLMAVVHPWRPVLYIVLLLCGGLELISWALEDLAPPFFSSRRDGRKGLKDLFQIIRQRCGGDDGSDFHKMGNLIIALICLGSEVALLLLYYRFTLSLPVQGEPGERLFHLIQVVVIPIASLAFALRQVSLCLLCLNFPICMTRCIFGRVITLCESPVDWISNGGPTSLATVPPHLVSFDMHV
eukprot:scaffold11736_cov159-Ochromonas_danica.AAC.11